MVRAVAERRDYIAMMLLIERWILVSARNVLRLVIKTVAGLLLIGSAIIAYNLSTTPLASIPVIGTLTVFFTALLVIGAVLILIY